MTSKLILVGRVAGAFGVKGEVRLSAYTAQPEALLAYRDLVRQDGSPGLTLLSGRAQKGDLVARVKEVATKEQADALRGLLLHVPREALPEPDEDEYYLTDLIGMAAVTPEGQTLGRVKAVQDFGAGDILEIDPGRGGATWYLPFTRACVPEVDIAGGKVTVVRPAETSEREP
ncbi:MAG: ribosome maturation factor RimM [Caulobacteraceae bacterium]